jgi:hypothetical protein
LRGVTSVSHWPNGVIRECRLNEENRIETAYGVFIPRYSAPDYRTKELKAASFHENGAVASIHLDKRTPVETPAGTIDAELLTFYDDGALHSVFPLNGQVGFGWSEEEEGRLAPVHTFALSVGTVRVRLNGIRFYRGGAIKSILFWPGETVVIRTPAGNCRCRVGLRLHEDGSLQSFEPAAPLTLGTPIGPVPAFDPQALALDADTNSVRFGPDGRLVGLATVGDIIAVGPGGRERVSSRTRLDMTSDRRIKLPLYLTFAEGAVSVSDGLERREFPLAGTDFLVLADIDAGLESPCGDGCGSCSACGV